MIESTWQMSRYLSASQTHSVAIPRAVARDCMLQDTLRNALFDYCGYPYIEAEGVEYVNYTHDALKALWEHLGFAPEDWESDEDDDDEDFYDPE